MSDTYVIDTGMPDYSQKKSTLDAMISRAIQDHRDYSLAVSETYSGSGTIVEYSYIFGDIVK